MDNEVMELIEALYSMVSEAWGLPLGNDKCIVERDKGPQYARGYQGAAARRASEAKRLVSARDEFIGNAKREAESIRRAAAEEKSAVGGRGAGGRPDSAGQEQRTRGHCRKPDRGAPPSCQRLC